MNEPSKNTAQLGEVLEAILKPIVKEAVREAMGQNGHGVEKPTEIPILSPIL